MKLRHPAPSDLRRWITDDANDNVNAHVDECARCATFLEKLASEDVADHKLGDALLAALAPPADFADRLIVAVNDRLSSRQMLDVMADIFGAGLQTGRMLLGEETNDTD